MSDIPSKNEDSETGAKRRLYESIFRDIARDIISGKLKAGETLPTVPQLCERFSVSRTVIREALQHLGSIGLVDVRHGAGTFVAGPDKWDLLNPSLLQFLGEIGTIEFLIDDLLEIRRMFEVEAVTLAASRATPSDISALEELVARMYAPDVTPEQDVELNLEFHSMIVTASHNRFLIGLREQLRGALSVMVSARQRAADPELRTVSNAMHRQILEGIRERRPDRARAAMEAHVQGAERTLSRRSRDKPLDSL